MQGGCCGLRRGNEVLPLCYDIATLKIDLSWDGIKYAMNPSLLVQKNQCVAVRSGVESDTQKISKIPEKSQ